MGPRVGVGKAFFLESSDERVNTSLCLPCTTPPSQSGHHHFLPRWMLSHSSCPLVCTLACFHTSPTLCFSHIVCHSLANTFYWVPSGLIFTVISKPQAPQDFPALLPHPLPAPVPPPCSRTPSLLWHQRLPSVPGTSWEQAGLRALPWLIPLPRTLLLKVWSKVWHNWHH